MVLKSGLIGKNWAMVFASSGFNVALYDIVGDNVDKALVDVKAQLLDLESKGLLRGQISAKQQFSLITKAKTLEDCLRDAIHVQVFPLKAQYFIHLFRN